jgi:hypothetical protein
MSKKKIIGIVLGVFVVMSIVTNGTETESINGKDSKVTNTVISEKTEDMTQDETQQSSIEEDLITDLPTDQPTVIPTEPPSATAEPTKEPTDKQSESINTESIEYKGNSYEIISVDGGDLSGKRQANVAVDVGYGDRVYWALTNEYGQLVHVIADNVILQDDATEPVNSDGRYYDDEANVPGTEQVDLDQGHVIADSLGGVSNAYNITPQNSTLNRHGDQAYMEKVIRDAGGCENFVATIYYSDTETKIPSKYKFEYVLNGSKVVDEFENVNPDEINEVINSEKVDNNENSKVTSAPSTKREDISKVDTNGNGTVTISEAKAAGFAMPINSDHWLYDYMIDKDGDGMVGE